MTTSGRIEKELRRLGSKDRAESSAWFFKTGPGEYGYGDKFFGVSVPEQRKIAKKYIGVPLYEISKLLKSKIHECRLSALLILVEKFTKADETQKHKIARFYLKNTKYVNNWDLVDLSAPKILGKYLQDRDRSILYKLAKSRNLWEQRIAVLATFNFIMEGDYKDSLKIAEILLLHSHDLIHKAVGWMLREIGKKNLFVEKKFLNKHYKSMPRTMLRYAIEKFPERERKLYMRK